MYLISLVGKELLMLSIFPFVNFGSLCLSKNWSILSELIKIIWYIFVYSVSFLSF